MLVVLNEYYRCISIVELRAYKVRKEGNKNNDQIQVYLDSFMKMKAMQNIGRPYKSHFNFHFKSKRMNLRNSSKMCAHNGANRTFILRY